MGRQELGESTPSHKIFIASSWKNAEDVRFVAHLLRGRGHEVYDFTDPEHFVFNMTEETEEVKAQVDWIECGKLPATAQACANDREGLDWADTVILLLPAGRSAHMEAGIALGAGKRLFVYGDLPRGQFEVVYNNTPHRYRSAEWSTMLKAIEVMS